jgi:hypothetical protein
MTDYWYMEIYKKTGKQRDRWWKAYVFADVRPHVIAARKSPTDILRVLAPATATRAELDELHELGARPF